MNSTGFSFTVRTDLVVTGHNPELADYANSRGELIGEAHYVVACDALGNRYAHNVTAITRRGRTLSEITVEQLNKLVARLNETHPVLNDNLWSEIEPVYGSAVYSEDSLLAFEDMMENRI